MAWFEVKPIPLWRLVASSAGSFHGFEGGLYMIGRKYDKAVETRFWQGQDRGKRISRDKQLDIRAKRT